MAGIVIIGAGECGVRAAFELRKGGYDGAITIIGDENTLPYERPPLSKQLDGAIKPIRAAETYGDAGLDLRLGDPVAKIEAEAKSVVLENGEQLAYDKLLIATGARARLFPGMNGCLTMRTDEDARAILSRIRKGTALGIIGGGFIGLELAATARKAGADVTVIEAAPRLLGRAVPEAIAEVVHKRHEAEGVHLLIGTGVTEASATSVTLSDGRKPVFDIVVAGVGSLPNTALAESAGADVNNGIVVDASFRTSLADVYAAGDCCNFDWRGSRVRLESWKAAQDQGAHVAAAMLGQASDYTAVPWFWSDQYDLTLQVAGLFDMAAPVHRRETGVDTVIVFQTDETGALQAVAGIGTGNAVAKDIRIFEKLIERGAVIPPAELASAETNLKKMLKAA